MILFNEGATQAQADEAEDILGVLTTAYPGHPWAVRVYEGGFFIRHLACTKNWGMNCKFRNVSHDAAVMRREIIMMAGEWLERAGVARGRYDADQEITILEGAPALTDPLPDDVKLIMPEGEAKVRAEPRPQAAKGF